MFAHGIFVIVGILWAVINGLQFDIPAAISWIGVTMYAANNWMTEPFDQ